VSTPFQLFGLPHLVIIALIPAIAAALAWWVRGNEGRTRRTRFLLAWVILIVELTWYAYYLERGWFTFPYSLPLHLCDLVLWLTVYTLFTLKPWAYELIYYWGLAGTTMAVLTPDVSTQTLSYLTLSFFAAHGGIIVAILFLTWSRQLRPRPGSVWRAFLALHLYAALIALFNIIFETNYFYICEKPTEASLLDYMGPWPLYVLVGDALGLLLFWLLWLPFGKTRQMVQREPNIKDRS
jgi:hypothetical integral membrane protein (TIGR02206 family)